MKSFLFERYGYYPDNLDNNSFDYKGYIFNLTMTDLSEEEIKELDEVSKSLYNLYNEGCIIIKNRSNNYLSFDGEKHYVLWTCKKGNKSIKDLINMHNYFHNNLTLEKIDLNELFNLWEEKFEFIETRVISTLRSDDYDYNMILEGIYFAFGLAENALEYLKDVMIDLGSKINDQTLVHKRLNNLENNTFFDPFNLLIDSPLRDYAELYKSNEISLENIVRILDYYNLDIIETSVLMARVLYPTRLFDALEKHYIDRMNIKKEILDYRISIDKELIRIKNLHLYLIKRYGIRPLNWLSDILPPHS